MAQDLDALYTVFASKADWKGHYKSIEEQVAKREELVKPDFVASSLPSSEVENALKAFFFMSRVLEKLVKAVSNYGAYCLAVNGELGPSPSVSVRSLSHFGPTGEIQFGSAETKVDRFVRSALMEIARMKSLSESAEINAAGRRAISNYLMARSSLRARL